METTNLLTSFAKDSTKELRSRVIALYSISHRLLLSAGFPREKELAVFLISPMVLTFLPLSCVALGDFGMDLVTQNKAGLAPVDLLKTGLNSSNPRTRLEGNRFHSSTKQGRDGQ